MERRPGLVVLFGSGETSADAQAIHDFALRQVAPPVRAAVLETPAGFELNSAQVAGRLAEFLKFRLQNYRPDVTIVPARKRGTAWSPDDPAIVAPLFQANYLMMGPGSPSYAIRQLRGSLAWQILLARHRLGYPLVLASAATIAASTTSIPVYEIYKVGEDPHWQPGLNLFGPYGGEIAFVPHWDNTDGGDELDTTHCFMGRPRFAELCALLPPGTTIVGIDEHTALVADVATGTGQVMGQGAVTIVKNGEERRIGRRESFDLADLGLTRQPPASEGIAAEVWAQALAADSPPEAANQPSTDVLRLLEERTAARASRDWARADRLRQEIADLGWQINDGPQGAQLVPRPSSK
jgi:hypothetical protein